MVHLPSILIKVKLFSLTKPCPLTQSHSQFLLLHSKIMTWPAMLIRHLGKIWNMKWKIMIKISSFNHDIITDIEHKTFHSINNCFRHWSIGNIEFWSLIRNKWTSFMITTAFCVYALFRLPAREKPNKGMAVSLSWGDMNRYHGEESCWELCTGKDSGDWAKNSC